METKVTDTDPHYFIAKYCPNIFLTADQEEQLCKAMEAFALASSPTTDSKEQEGYTIGKILTEAILLHEVTPVVIEKELKMPNGILKKLMNDEYYTNSVPVVLFKNLLLSLHIPFSKIEAAMLPTFKLLVSKETPESLKKKPSGYGLWENEDSVIKYTKHLQELMGKSSPHDSSPTPDSKEQEGFNLKTAFERSRMSWDQSSPPEQPTAEGVERIIKFIEDRMGMIDDEPIPSLRGAYDAYLNVLNFIKEQNLKKQ